MHIKQIKFIILIIPEVYTYHINDYGPTVPIAVCTKLV